VPGVVGSLVELTDVAPTVLAVAGAPVEAQFHGQPLLARETGFLARLRAPRFAPVAGAKKTAFAEESAMRIDAQGRRQSSTTRQTSLYSEWVQLIDTGDGVQLYDLKADPAEEHDVAGAQPAAVAALTAELKRQTGAAAAQGTSPEVNDQLRSLGYVQ
jgi:arylsulfatase A-like enzyme